MDTYVKKSDVKRIIDHLIDGAHKSVERHPDDYYNKSMADIQLFTLDLAWSLIDAQKTYKIEKT